MKQILKDFPQIDFLEAAQMHNTGYVFDGTDIIKKTDFFSTINNYV